MEELLQRLSDETTQYILERYKSLSPYCSEGAGSLKRRAKEAGIKLVKTGGLHGWDQHWWCVEPVSGLIIDPTAGQFGRPNGIQTQKLGLYDAIPRELVDHLPHRDFSAYRPGISIQEAWDSWKKLHAAGAPWIESRGANLDEVRVDKHGREYSYHSYRVDFTWSSSPQIRSTVAYQHKSGNSVVFVNEQRRLITKTGKVAYPVRQIRQVFKTIDTQYGPMELTFQRKREYAGDGKYRFRFMVVDRTFPEERG